MSYEQRDNSGALFKNDKGGNDKRPDYRGSIKLGGVEYELAAWIKESSKGAKYMSLTGKVKTEGSRVPTGGRNDPRRKDPEDSIPF